MDTAAAMKLTKCPDCGLEAKTLLHRFCKHKYCPIREAEKAKRGSDLMPQGDPKKHAESTARRAKARAPKKLMLDITVNLTNGDEIDLEGQADTMADLGAAVERIIAESGELDAKERWSSLVVVVVV